jgi:8-oxo-dGTP pyrophosphatase MutT (NUDIX family)/phosphohistidine phosphatase SixA
VTGTVLAAGVVCWRLVGTQAKVLLVHRTQHKDVSLPKGKLDPGELLPQTAQRELLEETGLAVHLGAPVGQVHYTLPNGRPKTVYYWSAEVHDHNLELAKFRPNGEISGLEWLPIDKAIKKVSYSHDVEMIEALAARIKNGTARTFPIIVARHGKAVPPETWDGPDATRPLMQRGVDQSTTIAPSMAAFAPEKIISSTAVRCVSTITPLAGLVQLPVKETTAISQEAYEEGQSRVPELVAKRLKRKTAVALCSHGPVIPQIIREIALQTGAGESTALRHAANPATGDFSVLHVSLGKTPQLVAVESHTPS